MRKQVIGCALIGGGILLVFSIIFLVLLGSLLSGLEKALAEAELEPDEQIGVVTLQGMISSQSAGQLFSAGGTSMAERFRKNLEGAAEDDRVKAIVIRINSPGGEITASDTIYHAVKEARKKKPIVVYMDGMAASGGYYVACAANEIVANETTLTGSIGVIIQTLNYYELFEKVGLEALVFKSGALKDSLSGSRELTPEEEAYIQALVDQMYDKFLTVVAEGRDLPVDKLRTGIADGRVMSGADALEEGLVDATGYIEDAYERARELAGAPNAEPYRYREEPTFLEIIGAARQANLPVGGRLEVDLSDRLLPRLQPGMIYLLPSHFVP